MKKIKLTKGFETIVDDNDFYKFSKYNWGMTRKYAARSYFDSKIKKSRTVYLHREIMGLKNQKKK